MSSKEIEVGATVMLSHGTRWNTSNAMNPLNTKGVVVDQDTMWTYVDWENTQEGLTSAYKDLVVVESLLEDKGCDY